MQERERFLVAFAWACLLRLGLVPLEVGLAPV